MSAPRKRALITGITGQDGAYLAELLLEKGYEVHGIKRRSSSFNTERIDHLYQDPHDSDGRFTLHYGDLTDATNLIRIVQQVQPDEIYNLGAQSHVAVSFETPEYTANADALGTLRLLEAIRILGLTSKHALLPGLDLGAVRQGAGNAAERDHAVLSALALRRRQAVRLLDHGELPRGVRHVRLQRHPLQPRIAAARRNLRHPQDHARPGAHPRRVSSTACILGNLDARRDWGHAKDYVQAQWLMLQQEQPEDYVIATGEQHSVREFVELAGARARHAHSVERRGRRGAGRRREDGTHGGAHRSALFPPGRSRYAAGRSVARAKPSSAGGRTRDLRASWCARWRSSDLVAGRARRADCRSAASARRNRANERCNRGTHPARPRLRRRAPRACGLGDLSRAASVRATPTSSAKRTPGSISRRRAPSIASSTSRGPQVVILAAARVGGIIANAEAPADFIRDNLLIQTNVIDAAYRYGVSQARVPGIELHLSEARARSRMREEYLLTGALEPTNDAYAIAKLAGIKMCQAYRRQHGFDAVTRAAHESLWAERQFQRPRLACDSGADPPHARRQAARCARIRRLGQWHAATRVPACRRFRGGHSHGHGALLGASAASTSDRAKTSPSPNWRTCCAT